MKRIIAMVLISAILAMGLAFVQNSTPASSSSLSAITLTPPDRPRPSPPPEDPKEPGSLPRTGLGIYSADEVVTPSPAQTSNLLASVDPLRRLVIPSLEVNSDVMTILVKNNEWDISRLGIKTGWLESVAHPEQNSNTVLVGHLNLIGYGPGPFQKLARLAPGSTVQLITENYIYTYQVRAQRVIEDNDMSVVARTSNAQLTMITCSNWDSAKQDYVKRLVATADLVSKQLISRPSVKLMKHYFYSEY